MMKLLWALVFLTAAAAIAALPSPLPALSASKLSLHVARLDAPLLSWVGSVRPRLIKLLDPEDGWDAQVLAASPNTLLVGRVYSAAQPSSGDPEAAAAAWVASTAAAMDGNPHVTWWEGVNEPAVGSVAEMAWLSAFEVARVRLLAALQPPRAALVGSFSSGVPDVTNASIIAAFLPALQAAAASGGALGLHEYNSPTLTNCFSNATDEGWLTGRFRKLIREYLRPANLTASLPIVISESGVDNSPCGSPNLGGWLNYCALWERQGWGADCAATYVQQLAWYDSVLRVGDGADEVVATTVFCYACAGFDAYEVAPALPALAAYMNTLLPLEAPARQ